MTDEEILQKAIEKAESNGYRKFAVIISTAAVYRLLFSHDFAKAFWGDEEVSVEGEGETLTHFLKRYQPSYDEKSKIRDWHDGELTIVPRWKYYLKEMVLEEDPIKYLENFL